jgi:hypothetical protein
MNNKASVSLPLDELLVGFDLVQSVTTGSVVTASAPDEATFEACCVVAVSASFLASNTGS